MKDLLICNQNKKALAIILATQLIECKKDSQMMYVVNSKCDCMTSNTVPIQQLRSEQEEADTRMLLHGLDATKRGETSIFIQSQGTDVLVLMLWIYTRLCLDTTLTAETEKRKKYSTRATLRGGRRRPREGFTWLSRFFRMWSDRHHQWK